MRLSDCVIWGRSLKSEGLELELLLCRGFILKDFRSGSNELDLDACEKSDFGYRSKLNNESLISSLLPSNRYSSITSSEMLNRDFRSFLRCRFGARIPVRVLDPGIALLVKTLPIISVMTANCCSGHLKARPRILLFDSFHSQWMRQVFRYLFAGISGWSISGIAFELEADDTEASHFHAYWLAQFMARSLLDRENGQAIREAKMKLRSKEELYDQVLVHRLFDASGVRRYEYVLNH